MAKGRESLSSRRPAQWQLPWNDILMAAKEIVESYETGVTLRQLFYRLVSAEMIPNNQNVYKRLSAKTAAARREGWFPALIDRTRMIEKITQWDSPDDILDSSFQTYRRDRTEGQKNTIYIGVEKHGMTVQLMHWFGDLGIPVLALGGYSSQTFVDVVRDDIDRCGRDAILLYAGDFDPSGIDIDRDFEERTEVFSEVIRVALTKKQVEHYDLPPLPGKETDVRKWSFMRQHGELIQVELDALPPEELRKLYQRAIDKLWDKKAYKKVLAQEQEERKVLEEALNVSRLDNWVAKGVYLARESEAPATISPSRVEIDALMDEIHDLG